MSSIDYVHTTEAHNLKAARNFIPYLLKYIKPQSVIDIGCGLGTWLNVFKEFGAKKILGVDGENVDHALLQIPLTEFYAHDLRQPLQFEEKFDLAVCLEVAEHLPEENADSLVEILTNCSDTILFSAALPWQGGQNHINEQSFSYWVNKFNKKGFVFKDVFRSEVWNDQKIDWWYRQNSFLVVKDLVENQKQILDFYHPEKTLDARISMDYAIKNIKELEKYRTGKITFIQSLKTVFKTTRRIILNS